MYLNCGALHNSRRARPEPSDFQDKNAAPLPHTGSVDNHQTEQPSTVMDKESGPDKDNFKEKFAFNNDWSHLEGVYAKDFGGAGGSEKMTQFLSALCEIMTSYVVSETDPSTKVLDFHHPHQLKEMMAHCLDINPDPTDLEQILSDCRETLKYCIKTGHPHFLNQLSTGIDVIGMAGEWLTASANANMFTYEVAPVFTLMEEVVFGHMRRFIGWEDGEAIFVPGGALANLYGVLLSRHQALPEVKQTGLNGVIRPVVFTSEQSHFSIKRAAALLGIGTDNVIFIRCLANGKMDLADLRDKLLTSLRSGGTPIMINATCGTTVLGAFDPLNDLADICEEHSMWLHVDAAWGGGALLSRDHRHLFSGVERADSLTWNPHKMMGAPLQCSAFFTKHKGLMKACNSMGASYLFQKDKHYDVSYDTGDLSIQCGRHNDVFKLWLMWKAKGDIGFEDQIIKNFQLATLKLAEATATGSRLISVSELHESTFETGSRNDQAFISSLTRLKPRMSVFGIFPRLGGHAPYRTLKALICTRTAANRDYKALVTLFHLASDGVMVAPLIKAKMMESGSLMVQYQPLGDLPNFFRVAISNPILTTRDMEYVMDEIDFLGKEIPVPHDWND